MSLLTADANSPTGTPDSPRHALWARAPWVFVVARDQGRLLEEIEALFLDDPRVLVIEAQRQEHSRLPCGGTLYDLRFPIC